MRHSTSQRSKLIIGRAPTRRHRAAWLASLLPITATLATSACTAAGPADEPEAVASSEQALYTWGAYGWLDGHMAVRGLAPATFSVCWSYPTGYDPLQYRSEMDWVRAAVTSSWQQNSAVTFRGWDTVGPSYYDCIASGADIYIQVQPGGRGKSIDGNVYLDLMNGCPFCIRQTAVHEFGHALGFADSMYQPVGPPPDPDETDPCYADGDDWITHPDPHGVPTGDWDSQSVMGYPTHCGVHALDHGGRLSETDKLGVQRFQGRPNYFADVTGPDVDGMSRADAIVVNRAGIFVKPAGSNGFGDTQQWTLATSGKLFPFFGNYGTYFADVDGDGKADAIAVTDFSINVLISNGGRFVPPPTPLADRVSPSNPELWAWASKGTWGTFFADVTGPERDGKSRADAITISPTGVTVRKSTGTRFADVAQPWSLDGLPVAFKQLPVADFLFGDVTGDGKADLVLLTMDSSGSVVQDYVFVSNWNGNGFNAAVAIGAFSGTRGTFLADVTGDGRADLIALNDTETLVRAATSRGNFGNASSWTLLPDRDANASNIVHGIFFAEVTGRDSDRRRRADALTVYDDGIRVRRAYYDNINYRSQFRTEQEVWSLTYYANDSRGCSYMTEDMGWFPSNPNQEEGFFSCDNRFELKLQQNGDLVLLHNPPGGYAPKYPVWRSTNTYGYSPTHAAMQEDGNLVIYYSDRSPWAPGIYSPGAYLAVQNDGNFAIYDRDGTQLWTNNTCGGTGGPEMQVLFNANEVAYCIDKTEVTRGQYQAWVQTNPSPQTGVCSGKASFTPDGDWPPTDRLDHPVTYVDWCDAYEFCRAANKRLCGKIGGGPLNPYTEATTVASQWHNACTSGGANTYPYGLTYVEGTCNGNHRGSGSPMPVGSLAGCQSSVPGYTGVYDLSGNVFEWEDACWNDGEGGAFCRLRGGSYDWDSNAAACGYDHEWYWELTRPDVGFRCCGDLCPKFDNDLVYDAYHELVGSCCVTQSGQPGTLAVFPGDSNFDQCQP